MSAIRRQVYSIPGMSIVNMLQELEKHLREFTSREYNDELSRYLLEGLEQLNSNLHEGHVAALMISSARTRTVSKSSTKSMPMMNATFSSSNPKPY